MNVSLMDRRYRSVGAGLEISTHLAIDIKSLNINQDVINFWNNSVKLNFNANNFSLINWKLL